MTMVVFIYVCIAFFYCQKELFFSLCQACDHGLCQWIEVMAWVSGLQCCYWVKLQGAVSQCTVSSGCVTVSCRVCGDVQWVTHDGYILCSFSYIYSFSSFSYIYSFFLHAFSELEIQKRVRNPFLGYPAFIAGNSESFFLLLFSIGWVLHQTFIQWDIISYDPSWLTGCSK